MDMDQIWGSAFVNLIGLFVLLGAVADKVTRFLVLELVQYGVEFAHAYQTGLCINSRVCR